MPVIDYAGGGSALAFVKTIDNLLALDFDTAIPGHGKVMTKPEVQALADGLRERLLYPFMTGSAKSSSARLRAERSTRSRLSRAGTACG